MYRHCLLLSCLVASLPAQTSIHPRTDGATVTFAMDGPTRFGQRMAKTKLYAMTQSKPFQELWAPLQAQLDAAMEANKGNLPIEPKVLLERVLAYGGRVHGALWMDLKDLEGEGPRGWGYLIVEPDGTTDLVAMCKELEKAVLEDKDARSRQLQLGGGEWLVGGKDAMWVSLPRMVGDRAVMLMGGEANQAELAALFEPSKEPPAKDATENASAPALHATFDAGWLMNMVAEQMEASGQAPFDIKDVMKALGAEGLGRVELRIREDGQHVDIAAEVEVAGEPRGMRAMMYPDSNKPPALLGLVPRQSATFGAIPMVVRELEPMVKEIMKLLPQEMTWDDVEVMVEAQVGVRLGQDVLAHFGDELLWIGSPPKPKDPDAEEDPMAEAMAAFDGVSFGLALRDGTALNRSLETILDRSGVLRMRKSEKYRDIDVHRITLPLVDKKLHWAITDKLLFVGIGDVGVKNLQNVLDEVGARARGEAPAAFAPGITKRLEAVEPGYSSVSVAEIGWILETMLTSITEDEEFDGDVEDVREAFAKLQDLMRSSDLSHVLTVQYSRPGRVVQRTIW
jgi:hypothetical protein